MTLLCCYSIGGIASVLTSDTRRIMTLGGKEIPIVDNHNKIHQITDSIICAGGGFDSVVDFVIKQLKERLSHPVLTLSIESIIKGIDVDVQDKFKKHFKKGERAQILITGFNALGTSFNLNYIPDAEEEERIYYNTLNYGSFNLAGAFPEGYENTIDSLQEASHQIHANMTEVEMAQTLLISIIKLQQAIHGAAPGKVSEWLCYSIVLREGGSSKPVIISEKVNIISTESEESTNE